MLNFWGPCGHSGMANHIQVKAHTSPYCKRMGVGALYPAPKRPPRGADGDPPVNSTTTHGDNTSCILPQTHSAGTAFRGIGTADLVLLCADAGAPGVDAHTAPSAVCGGGRVFCPAVPVLFLNPTLSLFLQSRAIGQPPPHAKSPACPPQPGRLLL